MSVDPQPPPPPPSPRPDGGSGRVRGGVVRGLRRPRHGRLVAGVLAGLARRFGVNPWTARALFVLSLLLPGPQILAYVVMWVIMPTER